MLNSLLCRTADDGRREDREKDEREGKDRMKKKSWVDLKIKTQKRNVCLSRVQKVLFLKRKYQTLKPVCKVNMRHFS